MVFTCVSAANVLSYASKPFNRRRNGNSKFWTLYIVPNYRRVYMKKKKYFTVNLVVIINSSNNLLNNVYVYVWLHIG